MCSSAVRYSVKNLLKGIRMTDFDWQKWAGSKSFRRTLIATSSFLKELGVSQDYWDMAVLFSDLRNEHPAFHREIPVGEALELGMKGLEAMFEHRNCELGRDKALLDRVIRDFYNGDKAVRYVVSRMDDIRGGDGDIYRKISESRRNEDVIGKGV